MYFSAENAHDTVLRQVEPYKSVPTLTLRTSTYKNIFKALHAYDEARKGNSDVALYTSLITLRSCLENWMVKPAHVEEFQTPSSASAKIKPVFDELLADTDARVSGLMNSPQVRALLGKDIAAQMLKDLQATPGYSSVSNPLLCMVLQRMASMYTAAGLTPDNFRQELFHFIVSDNDLRGASSFLSQALGDKGKIRFAVDFGKLLLPFLKLTVDLIAAKTSTTNSIFYFDCLATDYRENGEDLRYGFYKMVGWSRTYEIQTRLTAGVSFSLGESTDPLFELQIAGMNAMPSLEPLSAEVGASISVGAEGTWTITQAADREPHFFTSLSKQDTTDMVLRAICSKIPDDYTFDNRQGAVLYIYSNAYGGDATVDVKAGANAAVVGIELDAQAGVRADMRKSTMILQSPARSLGVEKKTTKVDIWFKQFGLQAKAETTVSAVGNTVGAPSKEVTYDAINTIAYSAVTGQWASNGGPGQTLQFLPRSGYSRGQSVSLPTLLECLKSPESSRTINYFQALAQQLRLDQQAERIKTFFSSREELLQDIVENIKVAVIGKQIPESVLSTIFLEASYALCQKTTATFNLEESTMLPNDKFTVALSDLSKLYLQSLRLRIPRMDRTLVEKPGFKFGINLGMVKFGIDLGMVESASMLALTDIAVDWYDEGGAERKGNSPPDAYVPSTPILL